MGGSQCFTELFLKTKFNIENIPRDENERVLSAIE